MNAEDGGAPTYNQLAQINHLLGGSLGVLGPVALFGPAALPWAVGITLALATCKEFFYDMLYETPDTRGSSLLDLAFYCLGVAASMGAWLLINRA